MQRVVVVTGAAGFIGNAVASRLHKDGHKVVALDDFSSGRNLSVEPGLLVVNCDLRSREQVEDNLPSEVDAIVHCAAQSSGEVSFDDPWDDMTRHVNATLQLLEVAAERGVAHFVYTSSMAAYGNPLELPVKENSLLNPLSFYGAGKAATEHYVRLYSSLGMSHSILRPFSVYGPGQDLDNLRQGMISIYLAQLMRSGHVVVKGSLDRFRDFVHIDDAVSAVVAVLESEATQGQTMNLCSGKAVSVREIVGSLLACADAGWDVVEIVENTPGDQFGMFGNNVLLRNLADWEPKWEIQEGIADMWTKAKSLASKDNNE